MGTGVGVHTDKEVEKLSKEQREQLKEEIVRRLRTSDDILRIIMSDRDLLPEFMKRHPEIKEILRKDVQPTYSKFSQS